MAKSSRAIAAVSGALILLTVFIAAQGEPGGNGSTEAQNAKEILKVSGVKGGLVVHLGCGNGKLTAALRHNDSFKAHGLDRDPKNVSQARQYIHSKGLYGPVAIDRLQGKVLPYIDNLINLVVVDQGADIPMAEVHRVLAPKGVAVVKTNGKWVPSTKPRPKEIDEWTHYLHDASGNPVAHDTVVGPPRHLQWLAGPKWSRHHDRMASMSALVSSGGRIFAILDEGSRTSIQLPAKWAVVARDAFNGSLLWKQRIKKWHTHLWPLKSGPTQLARRLVAVGERVYVTLGLEAPLSALDAATGKILKTYEGTKSTEEIIHSEKTLFILVNRKPLDLAKYAPEKPLGDQKTVGQTWRWDGKPREILAVNPETGAILWKKETKVSPFTLSADAIRVYYHDDEKVVALNRKTGKEEWTSVPLKRRATVTYNFGPRVVIYKDVVLYAGGDRKMHALDAKSGKELWSSAHAKSAYQSPEDLMIAGGLVWVAPTTRSSDSGVFTGRDPRTGKVVKEFAPNVKTYWFHHRCYIAKATDKFLLPSRTGIEFVDPEKKDWDIHHWVRGGCLYGIMPCNGLVYAPPHNCACYPETKLYGLNALAPRSSQRKIPKDIPEEGRLEKGPAYGKSVTGKAIKGDWATYRHDNLRSGRASTPLATSLKESWTTKLGGKLSTAVVANGQLYVAQIDQHRVHALDAKSGKKLWSFQAGGRVDSPPTIYEGRAIFGCADGWAYCLRCTDGELIWRYRAAPMDQRLMVFEQIESVWPVHGNILVENGKAYFVAGRSNFLDGGLRLYCLDPVTGKKLKEVVIDDRDPETGKSLQDHIKILNMPVGLTDVLSSDGKFLYMRSQRFDKNGKRLELAPVSGQPPQQGAAQTGEGAHLFSPTGFLDGSYFHRSYWVYGKRFAGGHAGYYQAGKYAPSGRILSFDDKEVYGFGRKPQYYRWTTTIEHQLFATSKEPPKVKLPKAGGAGMIRFAKTKSLDPAKKPLAVEAWVKPTRPNGVILARGGPLNGYALLVRDGKPSFVIRASEIIHAAAAKKSIQNKWTHLFGVLTADKKVQLYVNGQLEATAKAGDFLAANPQQAMEIGGDDKGAVGNYRAPFTFTGVIDEVRIYHGEIEPGDVKARYLKADHKVKGASTVLECSFEKGKALDASGNGNNGKVSGATSVQGKFGKGMRFVGRRGNARAGGSNVKLRWTQDVPIYVRSMVLTDGKLLVAGPPDLIDEEETFKRLRTRGKEIQKKLAEQDAALLGRRGGMIVIVSTESGKPLQTMTVPSLPVWDGLIAAQERLYMATEDGRVVCFSEQK